MLSQGKSRILPSYRCCGLPISIPFLIFVILTVVFLLKMSESTAKSIDFAHVSSSSKHSSSSDFHFSFTAPTDYFLPALSPTNSTTFNPQTTNFGLIHQSYPSDSSLPSQTTKHTDWQRFAHHISTLNSRSPTSTSHHILFLSRHGQGYHNLAESYYGSNAWDCHFAELDGDPDPESDIEWLDAQLSKLGRRQAKEQHDFWQRQYAEEKMPGPQGWWVSPMERASRTAQITHGFGLDESNEGKESERYGSSNSNMGHKKREITVKEFLRETNGVHTCDKRRSRSSIVGRFPTYKIEAGFSEADELWDPIYRETDEAHTYRAKLLLDDILGGILASSSPSHSSDDPKSNSKHQAEYLSLTSHSGMIAALLRAVGHRKFAVQVGSAIAIYVQAERVEGKRPVENFPVGKTKPACEGDPLKAGLPGYKNFEEYVRNVEADASD